jgi:hypothetical protein
MLLAMSSRVFCYTYGSNVSTVIITHSCVLSVEVNVVIILFLLSICVLIRSAYSYVLYLRFTCTVSLSLFRFYGCKETDTP